MLSIRTCDRHMLDANAVNFESSVPGCQTPTEVNQMLSIRTCEPLGRFHGPLGRLVAKLPWEAKFQSKTKPWGPFWHTVPG